MKLLLAATLVSTAAAFAPASNARSTFALNANVLDTLAGLQGPGQVWGADGIAVGKEEADLKGYDNFDLFVQRCQEAGVAANLAAPGPFTVFAPTNDAIQSYELTRGPFNSAAIQYCIVPGQISSSGISSTPLVTATGASLTYSRKFRKDFVNDSIVGEKTFGPFADFPIDVAADNGVIHTVGIVPEPQ
eukprot:CAMPEP_0194146278 /NCGR_PEP_ID=MMETSP0152-20130528/20496_1 /TAXON_ID=1049557 /ORGANISM="Thalassiothrix antarctica, Strain L6-D1" /LENGTH=188 /DNA_ID=CAMNT_0038846761 /DNA_START=46 /DNA_END=612 /DNA_ORIENTATION=+